MARRQLVVRITYVDVGLHSTNAVEEVHRLRQQPVEIGQETSTGEAVDEDPSAAVTKCSMQYVHIIHISIILVHHRHGRYGREAVLRSFLQNKDISPPMDVALYVALVHQ